ncbi:hypothetical protein [Brevundimonas sp. DS20]|uniref:hypothetical protein n=1 Tax=Brevundimonas sp. DS20 TaxID=1532555 RepID=UPI0006D10B59|nr:hypothetical protein [Brevundimonas sp. DS20]ALJ08263.1 hypothetical protein JL11_07850 [Brevundimonas sp. DS20]
MMARAPEIVAAAENAGKHFNGVNGFANAGRKNLYVCIGESMGVGATSANGCGQAMWTIDREPGVTPFLTSCRHCGGYAQSRSYQVPQDTVADFEWYRPDAFTPDMKAATRDHILNGGLILRKIGEAS